MLVCVMKHPRNPTLRRFDGPEMPPSLCYFTLADPLAQRHAGIRSGERQLMLERNLKAALLIHDAVSIRASWALRSKHTAALLFRCHRLLEAGILRPELRQGDRPLSDQVDRMRFAPGVQRSDRRFLARYIDEAPAPILIDAELLSEKRSKHLVQRLIALRLISQSHPTSLRADTPWDSIEDFFGKLFDRPPVERDSFLPHLRKLFNSAVEAERFYLATYLSCGAEHMHASPIWTQSLGPRSNPDAWRPSSHLKLALVKPAALLAEKYDVGHVIESRQAASREGAQPVLPSQALEEMGVALPDIDVISFEELAELRSAAEVVAVRQIVRRLLSEPTVSLVNDIRSLRDIELWRLKHKDAKSATRSLVLFLLGLIPQLGMLCSIGDIGITVAGLRKRARIREAPLHVLSTTLGERARKMRRARYDVPGGW